MVSDDGDEVDDCTFVMFGLALFFACIPVQQRVIPRVEVQINANRTIWSRDPTLNAKVHPEQVPTESLIFFGVTVPVTINLLMNYVLPRTLKVRLLLTEFTKNLTGRFRPSFYDMCGWQYDVVWDGNTNLCTDPAGEKEGRKSFPSGHASFAWSTMLVLTLYLLGRSRLNCRNRSESAVRGGRKMLKLMLCFVPSFGAAWVAVTRTIDNWHHYADVLAGSIIGAVSACVSYSYNYGSVFSWDSAGVPRQELHFNRCFTK
ncbi:phosphatidic acid phosphatase [Phytophthora infestans T30-4]|uniref:Phosphatidic acid phosphatase n=1 Tax=Phytophthora infestans (strain T30-4) TaxID=403677 RepID=D0NJC9_PHYIT|nr:phosphatidic acid phosphatase [Phytophthora infestans T30-4]EEY59647.1 phosphatidic acid phosphatase [Phytophthora infestans T30-4]|eukprot:XP_002900840.1 phosphatidic acid phosphatase [Phytophthora infestans T30-4]